MAEQVVDGRGPAAASWARGLARFAGLVMAVLGVLHIVAGTSALVRGEITAPGAHQVFSIGVVAWGWVHIVVGALVGLAGMAVISGQLWGRVVGIVLVVVSIVVSFLSLSHHPGWSIVGIGLAVAVAWALCVFDEEASAAAPTMLD
ncbi:DUF7144 family membrane protein [Pseudonocardia asaccharolytica]|uniref:DUF7144 domain-containing protein n=1 Tax=Pseudonocardia asaccharolytica DSM 44247 = NBRC 16224 TaxID=1123024 RepID=A0A511D4R3_9PSEU|nr:hypothetical protein [Pseudonocardia asaccharolytica]GEL19780.1 hypothetical protein PA7_36170 [Pseudonocardia asaccharolytica DSM 44247 = NBRC 16224]